MSRTTYNSQHYNNIHRTFYIFSLFMYKIKVNSGIWRLQRKTLPHSRQKIESYKQPANAISTAHSDKEE